MPPTDPRDVFRRIGRRLAELRKARGWTQDYIAERLEIATRNVQALELAEDRPTIERLIILADLFEVDIAALFEHPASMETRRGRPRKQ